MLPDQRRPRLWLYPLRCQPIEKFRVVHQNAENALEKFPARRALQKKGAPVPKYLAEPHHLEPDPLAVEQLRERQLQYSVRLSLEGLRPLV